MKRILPILILLGIAAGALAVNPYLMVLARKNAAAAPSGITEDNVTEDEGTTDPSFSHTQGSLTDGYALVCVGWTLSSGATSCTVTYDGNSMTQLASTSFAGAYYSFIFGYALGSSGSGSKTVAVNHNGTVVEGQVVAITYSGVSQAGGFTTNSAAAFGTTASVGLSTTSADELVVACVASGQRVTAQQTEYAYYAGGSVRSYSAQHADGDGGTVTMSWTLDGAQSWASPGVVLEPSS